MIKVPTQYGAVSVINNNDDNNNKNKTWNNFEKGISFIVIVLTIICVIGYIVVEHGDVVNKIREDDKNNNFLTFNGEESVQREHGEHTYDFDLSIMSAKKLIITNCDDDDDISYDVRFGEYSYKQDIVAIANGILNNWDEFNLNVIKSTDDDDDEFESCFKNQVFAGNINCKISCGDRNDKASYIDDKIINFCEDYSLDLLNAEMRPNRRSCIFKEMAFQFTNICQSKSISHQISNTAFKWYKSKYGASKDWKITDCP